MMTLEEFLRMNAASSALPALTGLSERTAAAPSSAPNPPRMTLMKERFMPAHMM